MTTLKRISWRRRASLDGIEVKLFYYRSKPGNFGDELNGWLWPQLLPGFFDSKPDVLFYGFGSIFDQRVASNAAHKIIFGTGVRNPAQLPEIDSSYDIRFVRGPLSAGAIARRGPSITDSAVAVRLLPQGPVRQKNKIGFMPHFRTAERNSWRAICSLAGIEYIDPSGDVESTLNAIRSSSRIITEAMHGAIIADVFRVPWLRVTCYSHLREGPGVSEFKWADWARSLNMEVAAEVLSLLAPRSNRLSTRLFETPIRCMTALRIAAKLRQLGGRGDFRTSPTGILEERIEAVARQICSVRDDYRRAT